MQFRYYSSSDEEEEGEVSTPSSTTTSGMGRNAPSAGSTPSTLSEHFPTVAINFHGGAAAAGEMCMFGGGELVFSHEGAGAGSSTSRCPERGGGSARTWSSETVRKLSLERNVFNSELGPGLKQRVNLYLTKTRAPLALLDHGETPSTLFPTTPRKALFSTSYRAQHRLRPLGVRTPRPAGRPPPPPLQPIRGLKNKGRICFVNALMQCLARTDEFYLVMSQLVQEYFIPNNPDELGDEQTRLVVPMSDTATDLRRSLSAMLDKLQEPGRALNPEKDDVFVHVLKSISGCCPPGFMTAEQDLGELFVHLLCKLDTDMHETLADLVDKLEDVTQEKKIFMKRHICNVTPKHNEVFRVTLESVITCPVAQKKSNSNQPFYVLMLPVPAPAPPENQTETDVNLNTISPSSNSLVPQEPLPAPTILTADCVNPLLVPATPTAQTEGGHTMQSLLKNYTATEELENSCSICNTDTPHLKRRDMVSELPRVLVVQLKRYNSKQEIVYTPITLTPTLDMAPYCTEGSTDTVYNLCGVINHYGTLHGGHYLCYVKVEAADMMKFKEKMHTKSTEWPMQTTCDSTGSPVHTMTCESTDSLTLAPEGDAWFKVNDDLVQRVPESEVFKPSSSLYVLFYKH